MVLSGRLPGYGEGIASCVGVDIIGVDDATKAVILICVETIISPTVNSTSCSTIFWGLFCELKVILSVRGRVILGKAFPLLKSMHSQISRTFHSRRAICKRKNTILVKLNFLA